MSNLLMKCGACAHEVSLSAKACPKCGHPTHQATARIGVDYHALWTKHKPNRTGWVIAIILGIVVISRMGSGQPPKYSSAPVQQQIPQEIQQQIQQQIPQELQQYTQQQVPQQAQQQIPQRIPQQAKRQAQVQIPQDIMNQVPPELRQQVLKMQQEMQQTQAQGGYGGQ